MASKVVQLTSSNFGQEVEKSDIPVLVDFWAPWCGPCRMVGPVIDELAGQFAGKVKFGKVNIDEESFLSAKFRVMSIPTLIFFKNGKPAGQLVGARPKKELETILNEAI